MQLALPLAPDEPGPRFVRHRRARRYILRVLDDGSVRVTLPQWGYKSDELKSFFSAVHLVLAWVFMTLIAVHVSAAFKHLLVERDGVFWRMWPYASR